MILFLTISPLYICYSVSRFVCSMLQFNLNGQCVFILSLILITSTFSNICIAAFYQIIHHLFFKNHLAMLFLMSQSHMFHFGIYFFSLSWLWLVFLEFSGRRRKYPRKVSRWIINVLMNTTEITRSSQDRE